MVGREERKEWKTESHEKIREKKKWESVEYGNRKKEKTQTSINSSKKVDKHSSRRLRKSLAYSSTVMKHPVKIKFTILLSWSIRNQ